MTSRLAEGIVRWIGACSRLEPEPLAAKLGADQRDRDRGPRLAWTAGAAAVALLIALVSPAVARGLTISPLSGTPAASPQSQISLLGVRPAEIDAVAVVGSRSGRHSGRLRAYASAPGASFLPSRRFAQGESVRVSVLLGPAGRRRRAASQFTVARRSRYDAHAPATAEPPIGTTPQSPPGWTQSFLSTPGLHPPGVQVIQHARPDATGDVFLAPAHGPGQHGPMILDEEGALVWFQQAPPGDVAMNFQVERYEGKPVLAWWQGTITHLGIGFGVDELYSSSYQPIAQIAAGNGYQADLHDLQITPAGSAFITANSVVRADLSPVGGSRNGTLVDSILQEIDVKTGLVMFEWHALGHVPLSDSYSTLGATSQPWDYFHINSISLDPWGDGNFIISARNTWAAYEVSAASGSILWRLGGRRPSFRMGRGTGMAWQHDVRWHPDHTLTLFDDGATPREHAQSRAIRERIDWRRRATTLVGRLVHSPALIAGSQGDDQVLADGGSFVGWGEAPYITEFSASGAILFDARLPPQGQSYRAYRFPWSGTPITPPSLVVSEDGAGVVTAHASWNGATGVHAWTLLAGGSSAALDPITTVPRGGFETAITAHTTSRWFAAQALGPAGQVLASSATVSLQGAPAET